MQTTRCLSGAVGVALMLASATALADEDDYHHHRHHRHHDHDYHHGHHDRDGYGEIAFVEANGGYGVQFGETEYLPATMQGDYQHPIVNGPSVGGTVGIMLDPAVALFASYEYVWAASVEGGVEGVLDRVQGFIDYHTTVAGVRLYHNIGFGRLRAELGLGVVFPYHTTLEFDYGPALGAAGISGTGTRVDNYSVGFGGQAALGYDFPLGAGIYLSTQVKYKLFEAENSGETTELRNFVTDFTALPPTAIDADIEHGDGMEAPSTNSVQEVRLQLGIGWAF